MQPLIALPVHSASNAHLFSLSVRVTTLKNVVFISLRLLVDFRPLQGHTKVQTVCKQSQCRKIFFFPWSVNHLSQEFLLPSGCWREVFVGVT